MVQPLIPSILKKVVEAKLDSSGALAHVRRPGFGSNPLALANDNSMLFEFQGIAPDSRYRMLVSFLDIDLSAPVTIRNIGRSRDLLQFDLAVFCVKSGFSPDQLYELKNAGVHVICIGPPAYLAGSLQAIPDFIHVPGLQYDVLLEANLLANEVTKRLRKKFHLVLSELAAASYDEYGTFATKQVKQFEDELLRETLAQSLQGRRGSLAIDVGCGDGRHSRVLAKYFDEVIAFDLSRRMIEAARVKDRRQLPSDARPVAYCECDVEYEEFPEEDSIRGRAEFVCASFGMPSFVEDTAAFVRRVFAWLAPHGRALFTCYNSQSLALSVETPWRDRALSASIDLARHALEVELREDVRFSIYCRPMDDRVRDIVRTCFSIQREVSFPHIMSILPQSIFGTDDCPRVTAREIFPRMDRAIAAQSGPGMGHYVFLVLEKLDAREEGCLRTLAALQAAGVQYEVLRHADVVSTGDVQKVLKLPSAQMIKTVIFKRTDTGEFVVTLVPAGHRVDMGQLGRALGCGTDKLVLAPTQEVERRFGFPVGGIAPFGYEAEVVVFVDARVPQLEGDCVYTGAGDSSKTLKISIRGFLDLIREYRVIELVEPRVA